MSAFVEMIKLCKTDKELNKLIKDTLTESEIEMVEERFHILYELDQGLSQRAVKDKLNVSIATVTRGAKVLKKGKSIIPKLVVETDYFENNSFKRKKN